MKFFLHSSVRVLQLHDWLDLAANIERSDPSGGGGGLTNFRVVLPMIQRGFVWKPEQIIELWDSLLQGMPIGTLMVSEMPNQDPYVDLPGGSRSPMSHPNTDKAPLGLVDGQQRTLAMLMGWLPFQKGESRNRLWVDFGDAPGSGHLLRLRVTTINQPFGFRREAPNSRLSMSERRNAQEAYFGADTVDMDTRLATARPHPAGAKYSLPLDFAELLNDWRVMTPEAWRDEVYRKLASIKIIDSRSLPQKLKPAWTNDDNELPKHIRDDVEQRIHALAKGFVRVFETTEIPLLRVDPDLFKLGGADDAEPPLARLFKRIGSNATPLSDADYVFSVLKHLMPKVHETVEQLHKAGHVASLLTATDLVMTALRLAATNWDGEVDRDNPSKNDFHRMIWPKSGDENHRQDTLRRLLQDSGDDTLGQYFSAVTENLSYRGVGDTGLPKHQFPYLGRPLVQVLLRLAQVGYIKSPADDSSRSNVIRLSLYWLQWVIDKPKASRIAFKVIKEGGPHHDVVRNIYEAIVEEGAGLRIHSPGSIAKLGLAESPIGNDYRLRGHSRFATSADDIEAHRTVREFYEHWWRQWNYHHPMLLWLQRDYAAHKLPGDPTAGTEDETPYDFDHILPQAHWSGWTGVTRGARLPDFFSSAEERHYNVIGHAIGNVRVWNTSDNRSDGDASPKIKMGSNEQERTDWMKNSAIDASQQAIWERASPADESKKSHWDLERAQAFQQAVERRTFSLYERLFQEASLDCWLDLSAGESPLN